MANGSHLFKKGNQAAKGNGKPKTKARHKVDVANILAEENFCPFREAVRLYRLETTKTYAKIEIVNSLQKYIAPTLKAIDVSNKDDSNFSIVINTSPVEDESVSQLSNETIEQVSEVIDDQHNL